jgi:non-ribosomal peptide synthetase component F
VAQQGLSPQPSPGPCSLGPRWAHREEAYALSGSGPCRDVADSSAGLCQAAIYSIDEDRSLTFLELDRKSNQMAHYLYSKGLRPGDVCALYMMNKPEFVVSWLAMCKLGLQPPSILGPALDPTHSPATWTLSQTAGTAVRGHLPGLPCRCHWRLD